MKYGKYSLSWRPNKINGNSVVLCMLLINSEKRSNNDVLLCAKCINGEWNTQSRLSGHFISRSLATKWCLKHGILLYDLMRGFDRRSSVSVLCLLLWDFLRDGDRLVFVQVWSCIIFSRSISVLSPDTASHPCINAWDLISPLRVTFIRRLHICVYVKHEIFIYFIFQNGQHHHQWTFIFMMFQLNCARFLKREFIRISVVVYRPYADFNDILLSFKCAPVLGVIAWRGFNKTKQSQPSIITLQNIVIAMNIMCAAACLPAANNKYIRLSVVIRVGSTADTHECDIIHHFYTERKCVFFPLIFLSHLWPASYLLIPTLCSQCTANANQKRSLFHFSIFSVILLLFFCVFSLFRMILVCCFS